jgi:hypothetical protein
MKTLLKNLLKGEITKWSLPALLVAVVALSIAWSDGGHRRYQLGGGWIFSAPGAVYSALQIPLDPAGKTAAIRINAITYDPGTAGLLAAYGADTLSENTGEAEMTSRDSGKWAFVSYGLAQGNPPQIRAIFVSVGTLKYTGPDSLEVSYTLKAYDAAADTDGDGFPDTGTPLTIPGLTATAKRVPLP